MELKKVLSKLRSTDRRMVENLGPATIGAKVIELLDRGERVSRASLVTALRADAERHGADLSGTAARVALELLEKASAGVAKR